MNGGEHCSCVEIMYPLLSTGNLNWEAMSFKPILQCWIWSFVIVKCFDRWTWTAPWKRWLDDINTATKTRVVTHSVFCILGAQNALLYVIILSRKVHLGRMSSGLLFLFNTTGEKIVEYQIYYVSIWTTFCRIIAPISNLKLHLWQKWRQYPYPNTTV